MTGWLPGGLGRVLGAAGPPLWGSPGPPRGAFAAPASSGGAGHSRLWVLLGLSLLPAGGNRGGVGAAGTPTEAWPGGRRPPSGGSGARGSCVAALPPAGSRAVLQTHAMSGLPAAPVHNGVNKLADKAPRVPAQGGLPQLDQSPLIQPKVSQAGYDEALCCCCFLGILKEPPHLLVQPELRWMEDSRVHVEHGRPDSHPAAARWGAAG